MFAIKAYFSRSKC